MNNPTETGIQYTGDLQLRTFISEANPTPTQIVKFDEKVNQFLKTMSNNPAMQKDRPRLLNKAGALSTGNRLVISIWYIDLTDKPREVTILK